MRKQFALLLAAPLVLILTACDPPGDESDGFNYPLAVGNTWEYERESNTYYYSDSSATPDYEDTTTVIHAVWTAVTDKELLKGTVDAYRIEAEVQAENEIYKRVDYLNNQTDGLYHYAYHAGGGPMVAPKRIRAGPIVFKGKSFNSIQELVRTFERGPLLSRVWADSLIFEDPPIKTLHYPLEVGATWTYRLSGQPWRMDKKVIAKDIVAVPAGQFFCFEIQWLYDLDADGQWDEDITIYDEIGSIGLVRRQIIITGSKRNDEHGNPIRHFDVIQEYRLTDAMVEE